MLQVVLPFASFFLSLFAFVLHLNQRNEKTIKSDHSSESHCKENDTDNVASEPLTMNNIKCTIDDKTVLVKPKYDIKKICQEN